jgi:FkbM family methyltransferase
MTAAIKSALLNVLGQEKYLSLTSKIFFIFFKNGWLRKNPSYFTHYLVSNFIQPGFTVIDIGANLGYYACLFAEKTGITGKVLAVEPIELYRKVLSQNTRPFKQITILPYALGESEGILKMGNPSSDKHRHGLMRVLKDNEAKGVVYEVPVKHPINLFGNLDKIDYIKCDIEGYEVPVIPAMKPLLEKFRPVVQVETDGENKKTLMELFKDIHYQTFYAGPNHLKEYTDSRGVLPGDLIAIPAEKLEGFNKWMFA